MNPLNIVGLISNIIDALAETTPARLRRKSVWHKRRMLYWERKSMTAKTIKKRTRAKGKWFYHDARAELYSHEADEMESREDDR